MRQDAINNDNLHFRPIVTGPFSFSFLSGSYNVTILENDAVMIAPCLYTFMRATLSDTAYQIRRSSKPWRGFQLN